MAVTSDAGGDDTYALGETIHVTVTFSEAVRVAGPVRLKIDMDPAAWGEKWAFYGSGSGTAEITFTHTVVEPNFSSQGIAVLADSLELNNGEVLSQSSLAGAVLSHAGLGHDAAHKVDWRLSPQAPSVTGVAISSDAGADATYALDESIRVSMFFSEAVTVTGAPRLEIDMDPAAWGEKWAVYENGSGSTEITFTHTVVEPNFSSRGIAVLADTLELNNGTIRSAASQTDADLTHTGLSHDPNHKVDWQLAGNQAPVVVDTQSFSQPWLAEQHDAPYAAMPTTAPSLSNPQTHWGWNNAPLGVLVSKPFHGVFSDPDGDKLTYTASITGGDSQMAELFELTVDEERRRAHPDPRWETGLFDRVWFRAQPDTSEVWKAAATLADPLITTVTLTATDPGGLSASVYGYFVTDWDSQPVLKSAVASPQAIELTFDQAVKGTPAADQFSVNAVSGGDDGPQAAAMSETAATVSGVSVSGAVVTLEMASELRLGQALTVDYAHRADASLQRASGGDHLPSFTGRAVTVSLPELSVSVCDRTPTVRDILVEKVGGDKECGEISAEDLSNVRSISISGAGGAVATMNLKSGDFEGLSRLVRLNLSVPSPSHPGYIGKSYGLASLPAGIFDDLSSLRELDLSGNYRISALPEGIFDRLQNLRKLDLELENLSTLPAGAFDSLTNLEKLDLSANARNWFSRGRGLTALPSGIFDGLTSLTSLELHDNSLTELSEDVFSGLSNLEVLDLDGNLLTDLPEDVFDGLTQLQRLELGLNGLVALPEDVFDGLSSLQVLYLSEQRSNDGFTVGDNRSLTTLPADVFDGLSSLKKLELFGNGLTALPEEVFDGLSSLEELDLHENRFTTLPEAVFEGLANLRFLELWVYPSWSTCSLDARLRAMRAGIVRRLPELEERLPDLEEPLHPGLTALPADIFDGLSNLEELSLKGNRMTTLPADVFDGLSSLHALDLSHNCVLTDVPEGTFAGLSSLVRLLLGDTPVSPLLAVTEISNKSSVRELNLSKQHRFAHGYSLTELPPDTFSGYTNLEKLNLSGHSLIALPVDVFNGLSNLQELRLEGNDLTDLPEDLFAGLSRLEELRISGNELTELPEDLFAGLSRLEKLRIGSNELTELPEDLFEGLSSLYSLGMSYNSLTALPEDLFDGLSKLYSLDVHGNELAELPEDLFDGLSYLRELDLSHNSLTELPEDLFDGMAWTDGKIWLNWLKLDHNSLTELPEDLFAGMIGLATLKLRGNDLTDLPEGAFADLINLGQLDLRDNKLTSASEEMFNSLPSCGGCTWPAIPGIRLA